MIMEEYTGQAKSYEDAKLTALIAILATKNIEVKDEEGNIQVFVNGEKYASMQITKDNFE